MANNENGKQFDVIGPGLLQLVQTVSEESMEAIVVPDPMSPTSSQGSWVVDIDDEDWNGFRTVTHFSSDESARSQELTQQRKRRHLSAPSPQRVWATTSSNDVTAAQDPANPPKSPMASKDLLHGGVDEAGKGLVGLAREHEATFDEQHFGGISTRAREDLRFHKIDERVERVATPVVDAGDLTLEEARRAIAEAAIEEDVWPRQVPSNGLGEHAECSAAVATSSVPESSSTSQALPANHLHRANSGESNMVDSVLGPSNYVEDAEGVPDDSEEGYDGKSLDRLWRWTGILTAAKMGAVPIMVCAALAALSQAQAGDGEGRNERSGGGAGGGNGGIRCHSRVPGGGGGGIGCFPSMRGDRSLNGCIPHGVAPYLVVS